MENGRSGAKLSDNIFEIQRGQQEGREGEAQEGRQPYRPWTAPAARYGKQASSGAGVKEAYMGKQFAVVKAASLSYGVGDRVRHVKFGEGVVLNITEQKKDFEVTVDFDRAGQKRMYATFAKLEKL